MSAVGTELVLENLSGASIDAARINVSTAAVLVENDPSIPDEIAMQVVAHLQAGLQYLHAARALMPEVDPTSVHIITPPAGIIVPG